MRVICKIQTLCTLHREAYSCMPKTSSSAAVEYYCNIHYNNREKSSNHLNGSHPAQMMIAALYGKMQKKVQQYIIHIPAQAFHVLVVVGPLSEILLYYIHNHNDILKNRHPTVYFIFAAVIFFPHFIERWVVYQYTYYLVCTGANAGRHKDDHPSFRQIGTDVILADFLEGSTLYRAAPAVAIFIHMQYNTAAHISLSALSQIKMSLYSVVSCPSALWQQQQLATHYQGGCQRWSGSCYSSKVKENVHIAPFSLKALQ